MAKTHFLFSFTLLVFALFISFSEVSSAVLNKEDDLLGMTCRRSQDYHVCVSTINSDPRPNLKTSLQGFVQIFIDNTTAKVTKNRAFVDNLLIYATDENAKKCLRACNGWYKASIVYLQITGSFLKSEKYQEVNQYLPKASRAAHKCESVDPPVCQSQIPKLTFVNLDTLFGIAYGIVKLIINTK